MDTHPSTLAGINAADFLRYAREGISGSGNGGWRPAKCVECHDFEDAGAFVKKLDLSDEFWGISPDGDWYFRGQSNAAWPLLPSLYRDDGIEKLWPLIRRCYDDVRATHPPPQSVGAARSVFSMALGQAEMQAMFAFAHLSDELGLYSPEEARWVRRGAPLLDGAGLSASNCAWYAYAQHHGIPTRMLDWTREPLYAAFFAVDHVVKSGCERLAIWAIHRSVLEHRLSPLVVSTCGRWQHTYLHAQDGLFISRPQDSMEFVDFGHWLPFDAALDAWQQKPKGPLMRLLTLPKKSASDLRRLLWRQRISRAHLMPGYSTVAEALLDKWTWAD